MHLNRLTSHVALACLGALTGVIGAYTIAGMLSFSGQGGGGSSGGGNGGSGPPCNADDCCYVCEGGCRQVEWFSRYGIDFATYCSQEASVAGGNGTYFNTMMECGTSQLCGGGGQGGSGSGQGGSRSGQGGSRSGQGGNGSSYCYICNRDSQGGSDSCKQVEWGSDKGMDFETYCTEESKDEGGDGTYFLSMMACGTSRKCSGGGGGQGGGNSSSYSYSSDYSYSYSSSSPPSCADGIDNDGDMFTDQHDPDCYSNGVGRESNAGDAADIISRISGPDKLKQGDVVTYAVTIENQGTAFANGIDTYITLSTNVTYIGDESVPCNRTGNSFHCSFVLQPQQNEKFDLQVIVNDIQPANDCNNVISAIEASAYTTTIEHTRNNNVSIIMAKLECEEEEGQRASSQENTNQQKSSASQESPPYDDQQRIDELQQHLWEQQLRDAVHTMPVESPPQSLGCFTPQGVWSRDRSHCDTNQEKHFEEMGTQETPSPPPQIEEETLRKELHQKFVGDEIYNGLMQEFLSMRNKLLLIQKENDLNEHQNGVIRNGLNWLNGQIAFYNSQPFSQENVDTSIDGMKNIINEVKNIIGPPPKEEPDISDIISQTWSLLQKTYYSLQVLFREQINVDTSIIMEFQRANTLLIEVQDRCYKNTDTCGQLDTVLVILDTILKDLQNIVDADGSPEIEAEISDIFAQ